MKVAPMIEQKVTQGLNHRILTLLKTDYNFIVGDKVQRMFAEDLCKIVKETTKESWQLDVGQILWLAVDKKAKHRARQSREELQLVPVILTVIADEDLEMMKNGFSLREIRKHRVVRLFWEAFEQGGLLTHSDVALILNVSTGTIGKDVKSYMETHKEILPTRGIIHDIGPGVTHKNIVIEFYESGLLLPEISKKTRHSEESCQRYIKGYKGVKLAAQKHPLPEICRLTGMGARLAKHYITLVRKYGHPVMEGL